MGNKVEEFEDPSSRYRNPRYAGRLPHEVWPVHKLDSKSLDKNPKLSQQQFKPQFKDWRTR